MQITPSHIIQYLYCPRFTFFEHVLRMDQFEEKNYKVMEGRNLHDAKSDQNRAYLRQRIGVIAKQLNVYLSNEWLRGEVDEVLWLKDGTAAPLDYKFAKWEERLYETYKIQLACYAWLIQDRIGLPVHTGYLVYTRSKNYLKEVKIGSADILEVQSASKQIQKIIEENWFPPGTKVKKRCYHCTYKNVCAQ